MKKLFYLLTLVSSISIAVSANASSKYFCADPEISGERQNILLEINSKRTSMLLVINKKVILDCKNIDVEIAGQIHRYGEGTMSLSCKKGEKVTLINNYDEKWIDISELRLALGDTRYLCE